MNTAESWQAQEAPQAPIHSLPSPPVSRKDPKLAAFLSFFPGVGHIYNGLYMRGLTFFLIGFSLLGITSRGNGLFSVALAFFWIFNVLDSYRQAVLINYGYAQDLGVTDLPTLPRASQGGLAAGLILTLIGTTALLDRYFVIDFEWIFDLWPVGLIAIGGWLIWGWLRDRIKGQAEPRLGD